MVCNIYLFWVFRKRKFQEVILGKRYEEFTYKSIGETLAKS
jgi:hypothetical protein